MIVVLASCRDGGARSLVSRWAKHHAQLMTCKDLGVSGWRQYIAAPGSSAAVAGARIVREESITGVLTLLPWVDEDEVVHMTRRDRAYAAAECAAFLVSWLSRLRCPVLNRPTAACLSGPGWRPLQWAHAAANLGIPVRARSYHHIAVAPGSGSESADAFFETVTVVGKSCFGPGRPRLIDYARRLAEAAGVGLLAVRFTDAIFDRVDPWPDIATDEIAEAVLDYLHGRAVAPA